MTNCKINNVNSNPSMSIIEEIESFQKVIKEDISLTDDYKMFDDYDCLIKKWDNYKNLYKKYKLDAHGNEFLSVRRSISKLPNPSLDHENNKLLQAIRNIHCEYLSDNKY
ncbi:hypothetical protein NBO_140g0003 [Nosema bombycis CQ1]|uniref:Uncharacterized protein n=1 Tax=Nosema bombycis (strain CQ1 / CVCC 102059) TaxID=578461 RepID=R0MK58_NOSB1|nr:hypothetical protein NBO_140g0003 [Nosema bombycis CQ1]|eukprot:EOB13178.1 hypothetical protein NBO_140g0003 [Nosema bombycis CQ1]